MRILELGSYVAPAYAGLILAEQGHDVTKVASLSDPVLSLNRGEQLFSWLNQNKKIIHGDLRDVDLSRFDAVIDNIRLCTWRDRIGMDPAELANAHHLSWASLRSEDGSVSFDAIAQARAWGDKGYLPFYIGDTAAGLWLAFKLLNTRRGEHSVVYQSTVLAKLVEGNLQVPWQLWDDLGTYYYAQDGSAVVRYKDSIHVEPARNDSWRSVHLKHDEHGNYLL